MTVVLRLADLKVGDFHTGANPLTEMMALLHVMAEPDHHPEVRRTLVDISGRLTEQYLAEFDALSPLWARYRCRLFFPMTVAGQSLEAALEQLVHLSDQTLFRILAEGVQGSKRPVPPLEYGVTSGPEQDDFLRYCRSRSINRVHLAEQLVDGPRNLLHRITEFVQATWTLFFADEWHRVASQLTHSAIMLRDRVRRGSWPEALVEISPTAEFIPALGEIRFDKLQNDVVDPHGLPVIAVPSVFMGPHLTIKDDPGLPAVIHYAALGVSASPQSIPEIRNRLAALTAESRMDMVRHLCGEPITTSELAMRMGQSHAQTSRALGVLRDADLAVSERRGKYVYHRINLDRLLHLGNDIVRTLLR